jgi:protein Mpv17
MVGVFFSAQTLLEGKGTDEVQKRLEKNWWNTLQTNWGVSSYSLSGIVLY